MKQVYVVKKILVTTDFSDYSVAALDYAISLADIHGADLHLLHIIDDSSNDNVSREKAAARSMQKFIFEKSDEFTWITQVIRHGEPHREIVRYAREQHVDMIVIATHGRTGLAHVLMGSIAEKIIRYSPIPVLGVKPDAILERLITEDDVENELHIVGG